MQQAWAVFFARWIGGLMWLMAGWTKVTQFGALNHAENFFVVPSRESGAWMPEWLLWAVGSSIPFVELIAGGLLLLGLRTRDACVALGFVLIVVTYGHLLQDGAFWSPTSHVLPRTLLLLPVLLAPRAWDRLGLDAWLARRRET